MRDIDGNITIYKGQYWYHPKRKGDMLIGYASYDRSLLVIRRRNGEEFTVPSKGFKICNHMDYEQYCKWKKSLTKPNHNLCKFCDFPISDHPDGLECEDHECILGRYMEVVNEYASTCDGCGELTLHDCMTMDEKTQLGYCSDCVDEYIKKNLNEEKKMYRIQLYESKDGPRFRILAKNGNIIASSEAYANKGSRTRTVNQLIKNHGFELYESKLAKKCKKAKVIKPKKPFCAICEQRKE